MLVALTDSNLCEQPELLEDLDLAAADLRGARLSYEDLRNVHLNGADLRGAFLDYADLRGSWLWSADLRGAHLDGAELQGAQLRFGDLRASQGQPYLGWQTDLSGATLEPADLRLEQNHVDAACAALDSPPLLPKGLEPPPPCFLEMAVNRWFSTSAVFSEEDYGVHFYSSFSEPAAEEASRAVRLEHGLEPVTTTADVRDKTLYMVFVGPFSTESEAQSVKAALAEDGYHGVPLSNQR